jgi:hypothetical protein
MGNMKVRIPPAALERGDAHIDSMYSSTASSSPRRAASGRKLIHGAPPQAKILEAIDRALADREGDSCEMPTTNESQEPRRAGQDSNNSS